MLGRDVTVTISGLTAGPVTLSHYRVDEQHSNVFSVWRLKGGDERDWPADEEEWSLLSAGDGLAAFEPPRQVKIGRDGQLSHTFPLPHPGISYLEIIPGG
jgi:xylan 1,4-beta-xylosidase